MKHLPTREVRVRAADRLARGSALVWRRRTARLTAWVRAGRRDDLTGWQAALGPLARLVLVGVLAYVAYNVARALPWLVGILAALWCRAAWKAGHTPCQGAGEAPPAVARGEAMRALLLDLMGGASAIHLSTVLDHLQERPDTAPLTASWQVSDLRARLEALDIPVQLKVKAAGRGPTRGVRRVDLAPSPDDAEATSTEPSTAVSPAHLPADLPPSTDPSPSASTR
ncbi:hypothetical protein [Streptomyces fractus]|uniref:hypothetical protein n=1 Tax=Streptomyces fractus TaxID=641806 RepID=UPI003CEC282E